MESQRHELTNKYPEEYSSEGIRTHHTKICHFDIWIILNWRQLRICWGIKKTYGNFPYLTKSRNFWEMRTAINFLFRVASTPRRETCCKSTVKSSPREFYDLEKDRRTTYTFIDKHHKLSSHLFSPKKSFSTEAVSPPSLSLPELGL